MAGYAAGLRHDVVNFQVPKLDGRPAAIASVLLLAEQDVLVVAVGYRRGVVSVGIERRVQIDQINAVRVQAPQDVRVAGRLEGLVGKVWDDRVGGRHGSILACRCE